MKKTAPIRFFVQHRTNGAIVRNSADYTYPKAAAREALAYAEDAARNGHVGMVIEVVNASTQAVVWTARIPARFHIQLN